ncbi:MAG TPA: hypothetical protein VJM33_08335 [Microthrixaceae bacterium]|nr:hypothetical protein [Microthrixaceae bacterium]
MGDLDANGNAVAIETIKIEHQGFLLNESLMEPAEPSFVEPAD